MYIFCLNCPFHLFSGFEAYLSILHRVKLYSNLLSIISSFHFKEEEENKLPLFWIYSLICNSFFGSIFLKPIKEPFLVWFIQNKLNTYQITHDTLVQTRRKIREDFTILHSLLWLSKSIFFLLKNTNNWWIQFLKIVEISDIFWRAESIKFISFDCKNLPVKLWLLKKKLFVKV